MGRSSIHQEHIIEVTRVQKPGTANVGGDAAPTQRSLGMQEAIRCRCAHGKELASTFLCEVEVFMPQKPPLLR
jgi:hypothetical protein